MKLRALNVAIKKKLPQKNTNGELILFHLDIANEFNRFFSTIGFNLSSEIPHSYSEQIIEKPNFCMRVISELEIDKKY